MVVRLLVAGVLVVCSRSRPTRSPNRSAFHELRTALEQAYGAAGVPPPLFTDAITPQITPIRAVHIQELRQAVVSLEGG